MNSAQVAISAEFLKAFALIPKQQQKKVREFTEKFRANPTSSGINYEKIEKAKDPKVRSVRIDQTYRAIVVKPEKGDVYLCAWVDHHDKAYEWAVDRVFEVNPKHGHLQVYQMTEAIAEAAKQPEPEVPRLFDPVSDDALEMFGAPKALLPAIRNLTSREELESLNPCLPADLSDALYLLAEGMTPEETLDELGRAKPVPPAKVDTEDFSKALEKPESQQVFKVVGQEELAEMLTAPLEHWRVFLHPSQRALVEWNVNGPIQVLGGAGTGKTVVLMHRAASLAKRLPKGARILVTTFTKNLALDIAENLKGLAGDEFQKIEVTNLSSWAMRFMTSQGRKMAIVKDKQRDSAWSDAMTANKLEDMPEGFFRDEWVKVVQAQDVLDRASYFKARRIGRGTRLNRQQRAAVWDVFERYRGELERLGVVEFEDVIREARMLLEKTPGLAQYDAVLADEVQDFRTADLRLLRALAKVGPNDLFVVGDPHQRIYGHRASLGECGIHVRGRSRRLKINYRTTQRIGELATEILTGLVVDDMDGGEDNLKGYHSIRAGEPPTVKWFEKQNDEESFVVQTVKSWLAVPGVKPRDICLAARTNSSLKNRYQKMLENAGVDTVVVDADTPEAALEPTAVRVATMHRLKGLEFPRLILVAQEDIPYQELHDEAASIDAEMTERCLRYVAATRARDHLAVVYCSDKKWFGPAIG